MANQPSRFLKEIPAEYLDSPSRKMLCDDRGSKPLEGQPSLVTHPTFGRGRVQKVEYEWGVVKAFVDFKDFGVRKVSFTHLKPAADSQADR